MSHPRWLQSLHHDGSPHYVTHGHDKTVTLRLRADVDAPIKRVFLRTNPDGEQRLQPMQPIEPSSDNGANGVARWWEIELTLRMFRTSYRFFLATDEGNWWYTAIGTVRFTPTDATDFKLLHGYHNPSWVQDSVFYQIFPERFADGDSSNNVHDNEYSSYGHTVKAHPWGDQITRTGETGNAQFFGGDLQGITQHLDYLTDLGVSALYLNPIFTSPSNHKYDITDYRKVDPHFGGDEALIELRKALDERNMRLMLDIVPNHCSSLHPWFLAALADRHAPTAEFFTLGPGPQEYESWLGVRTLPKLNYRSEKLREEMYAGHGSIMRYWLRPPFRADAWRIDVANMLARQGENQLEHKIGRGIRRAVKSESPDSYLIGENFFDASAQLQGDELDAVMNYRGFSLPLLQWLVGSEIAESWNKGWPEPQLLPTDALVAQWVAFIAAIPWQIAIQQFNLLGSHDTPRIETLVNGDEDLARLAAALLFTFPGVPSVYYGDEIGLAGGSDPDNRRCMPWNPDEWNMGRRTFYQQLIQLRRTAPALRHGGFQPFYAQNETLAFLREAPDQRLLIVARRSNDDLTELPVRDAGIADGTVMREMLSGVEATVSNGHLPLTGIPNVGAQIWNDSTISSK